MTKDNEQIRESGAGNRKSRRAEEQKNQSVKIRVICGQIFFRVFRVFRGPALFGF
jgi:hypothetical protein